MQTLFGGSSSSSGPSGQTGFNALPPQIQQLFTGLASGASNTLNPGGTPNSSITSLPGLNTGATTGLSQLSNETGAITPESINTDITEQMNPYNSSVIGQIENAQNGNMSQLTNYLSNSGAYGANRGALGANDIAMQQANQVGGFLNGEYNTALNNALTTIPQANTTAATGAVNSGLLTQQQQLQNQLAPASALQLLSSIIAPVPSNTSVSQQSSSSSSGGIL
jgi:hypothetical protein